MLPAASGQVEHGDSRSHALRRVLASDQLRRPATQDSARLDAMDYHHLSAIIKTFLSDGVDYFSIAGEGGKQIAFGLTIRMALDAAALKLQRREAVNAAPDVPPSNTD